MLSHKFKTIFVHIPKTGGQSVEMNFIQAHGLTWKNRAPLLLRPNDDPDKGSNRLAHLFARQYMEFGYVAAETFAAYFKFAVVRNPYDRFVSFYNYREANADDTPERVFDRLGDSASSAHFMAPQTAYVTDLSGNIIVDTIDHFERLVEEMPQIFRRTIGEPSTLPHINSSTEKRLTREYLTPALRCKLYKFYETDFDRFGYLGESTS